MSRIEGAEQSSRPAQCNLSAAADGFRPQLILHPSSLLPSSLFPLAGKGLILTNNIPRSSEPCAERRIAPTRRE
jgi:hypothetical protein